MITLHLEQTDEYINLNEYADSGTIKWNEGGDNSVVVTVKGISTDLLATALGSRIIAMRQGEECWIGNVESIEQRHDAYTITAYGRIFE